MRRWKRFKIVLLGAAVASLPCMPVYAENTVIIENTFTTTDPEDTGRDTFDDIYEKDGVRYQLSKVESEIISTEEVEGDSFVQEMEGSFDKDAMIEPPATIERDGETYTLQSKELREKEQENVTKHVERTVPIYGIEDESEVPPVAEVVEKDDSGKDVSQFMPLIDVTVQKEGWDEPFEFPIQITDYDADVFMLNNVEIRKDDPLMNYSDDFLNYLGLSKDRYRITSIEWDGEEYTENGSVCRNAVARGDRYVMDVEARYGGEMSFGKKTLYYYECLYAAQAQEDSTIYTVKATGTYTEVVPETQEETEETEESLAVPETEAEPEPLIPETPRRSIISRVISWIVENPIAALGIGTLAIVGTALLILFILSKKRKKDDEEEDFEIIDFDKKDED